MNTTVLTWNESYSVGLETVDNQHKKFLLLINDLGESIAQKSCQKKGHELFFALVHFADEYLMKEKMLVNSLNDIDYSYFRGKHIEFLEKLHAFQEKYEQKACNMLFTELYDYLTKLYPEFISYYTPSLVAILKQHGVK